MKVCNNPDGCECTAFNQSYCKFWSVPKKKKAGGLKKTGLKPRSEKREAESKIYQTLKDSFLTGKKCAVFPNKDAGQVHHIAGRAGYADDWARERNVPLINDVRFFLAVSQEGHDYIHRNTVEAREKGWLI